MPLSALSIPNERSAPPKDLEIRPKLVKAWIESLPLAQGMDAGKKLLAHLGAVNRSKVDLDNRLQILDLYRPITATLFEEFDAIYGKSALPLGPRAKDALALARELAAELSAGYKIALSEKTGKIIAFGAKKQLPLLVRRAIEYLALVQRASYKSYAPVPIGVWKELHTLYLFAEKEGVATEPADPETKTTVTDAYTETLLLSLTDPYRLVQGEADKIIAQIRGTRAPVTLGQKRPETRPGGHFLVQCDQDRPPKPMLSVNEDKGGPNWRLFDANAVVDKLRTRKQAMETGNVSATTSKALGPDGLSLLARLLQLWGDPPKRAYRRDPMETSVALCVGLKAVSHFVTATSKMDPMAEAEAIREGITIPLLAVPDDEAAKAHPVFEWDVVNQSEGGLKVRRVASTQPIGVGDVIGIKAIGKPHWTVGVVRWINVLDDGAMEFGLQFFAPAAAAVWIQPTISANPQAKQGLLLADGKDLPGEALLAPPNTYADLREFEIQADDTVSRVRAAALIEKNARFELFHVSPS